MITRTMLTIMATTLIPALALAATGHAEPISIDDPLEFNEGMLVSGIILALTFIMIFTEMLHGIERVKCAAAGAVAIVIAGQIYGFYTPALALEAVDWNVVFLLGAMMTIVAMMIPTGGFDMLAYKIADLSKGRLYMLLALTGTCVTAPLLSLLHGHRM